MQTKLPALVGSDKQINWTVTLRRDRLESLDQWVVKASRQTLIPGTLEAIKDMVEGWRQETSCRVWIDNRETLSVDMVKRAMDPFRPAK